MDATLLPCRPMSFELPELLGVEGVDPCRLLDPKLVPLLTADDEDDDGGGGGVGLPFGLLVRLLPRFLLVPLLPSLLPLLVIGEALSIRVRTLLNRARTASRS